ncbi:MAG: hypothetical protein FRX49_02003 [Trebouxia sp. A1-2]|nr:MAG: hypothetical protein FRX49_02003 [Trebouxia sp. A1-2]
MALGASAEGAIVRVAWLYTAAKECRCRAVMPASASSQPDSGIDHFQHKSSSTLPAIGKESTQFTLSVWPTIVAKTFAAYIGLASFTHKQLQN